MNAVVTIPSTEVRSFAVDRWSNDLVRGPLVLTDSTDRRVSIEVWAISPSAAPLDIPPIAGTPGLRAYRRGVGPVQVAAPLSRYLALEVSFNGVDADEASAIALSIPVMGSPQLFEAPDDSDWDGKPEDEESVRALVGHDSDVTQFAADHGGGFDIDWSSSESWGVFHSSWADGSTLREYAVQASRPVLASDDGLPMVVGTRETTYTQVMWFQRQRFWHLIENLPADETLAHARRVSEAVEG